MQGVHAFEPKTKATIDLESFVVEDHFLRRINRVLDLSFIRELTTARYSDGQGRPSIDPEVYFRMQLVAYFYGIAKDRRLCEEVRYNLAYRWFCRLSLDDDVPDHSSLTRIRDRLGEEVFKAVFRRIVAQCQQKGLVKDPSRVMTDATLIAADASLNSLIHNDPQQARQEAEAQRQRRGTIDGQAQRTLSNQTHRSRTDPDATLAQIEGLFAEAKQFHGLSRAKYRGRSKMQIQAYLTAIVQNLKRLLFPLYCWLAACWSRLTRRPVHR
jgi:transposase